MKVSKIIIVIIIITFKPPSLSPQIVHDLLTKTKTEYYKKNYYTALNLCRDIIGLCRDNPVSECWFTNVMKNVYRYKGLSEYEIYKKELKRQRLENAIQSLELSYGLYKDADILFMFGYLSAIRSILMRNTTELDGLVKAWQGIIELYGRDNWIVTPELVDKIKDYIQVAEKFSSPKANKNYSGKFAQYIIIMACKLGEKAQIRTEDKKLFNQYRKKYQQNKFDRFLGKLTE